MAGLLPRSIFLAAVPWLLAPLAGNARAENALPNVLFIFADDWGWGDMSLHDSPTVRTPNLDRFFRQGTEFQQFHVNSPVCSPSRAALYTGQFPGRNKVFYIFGAKAADDRRLGMNDWIDPQVTMLPRLMREAGYVTGHYGKWPELAVVKDNWRLMMTKDESRVELYDILGDWSEEENVAGRHPDVAERLKKIALDYHASLPPSDQFDEHLCVPESRK